MKGAAPGFTSRYHRHALAQVLSYNVVLKEEKYYIEGTQAFILIQQFSFHFYMLLENDHFVSLV